MPFPDAVMPFPDAIMPFPDAIMPFPDAVMPFPDAVMPFLDAFYCYIVGVGLGGRDVMRNLWLLFRPTHPRCYPCAVLVGVRKG